MLSAEIFWTRVIPALNEGLVLSLALIIPSAALGFLGGVLVGAVRVYATPFFRNLADWYVALFRGVPLLLQLYFLYYALPKWGVRFSAYEAAVLGFVLCSSALKGNLSVLDKIRNSPLLLAALPEQALLDDVLIENKQATDMAEIYMQIMGSLSDAFGAIVSNNLNKVMKVLTGLTIVFMVPSIIGALYGMNVALPLQDSPFAFAALCVLCLGLSAGVFYILRKMDWM